MKATKQKLVEKVMLYGYSELQSIKIVNTMLQTMFEILAEGQPLELRGLGSFEPRIRKGRADARNPRTGEIVGSRDRYTVVFTPGSALKEQLRSKRV